MTIEYDPELRPYVDALPALDLSDVVAARSAMDALRITAEPEPVLRNVHWNDQTIGADGTCHPVLVRVYTPTNRAMTPTPAAIFIHGGGFVLGSIDSEHLTPGVIAASLGVVVVSVDYRLAPEHPFPAALEDCYTALCWLSDHAATMDVDRSRIAVVGFSAGGGLAAALSILTRDREGPAISYQYLGIPELDDRLSTASARGFTQTPLWNHSAAALSWQYYLGDLHGTDRVPIVAAPGRAVPTDLKGLPPAYISAMQYDPLRDEAIEYAQSLLAAGVPVELHLFPGTFHGSAQIAHAAVSRREGREMFSALRAAFALPDRGA